MKTTILSTIILCIALPLLAQDFAPVGAEWYYTELYSFSGDKDFLKITSVKDTTYQGKVCRKLIKEDNLICSNRPSIEYVYSEDSAVFFWDADFNEFQKLYDFKSKKNDTWSIKIKNANHETDTIIVTVDSTEILTINEKQLKTLHVFYSPIYHNTAKFTYQSKIVEKIGDFKYLFNFYPESVVACDANESGGLRCYEDSEFGLYSTGIADSCTYRYKMTSIDDKSFENSFQITPNPTAGEIQVIVDSERNMSIELCDLLGRKIYFKEFISKTQIDLSGYSDGLYIATLKYQNKVLGIKKILKK